MDRFHCQGFVKISIIPSEAIVRLHWSHGVIHDGVANVEAVPDHIREYIAERSLEHNFKDICVDVWKKFPRIVLRPTQIRHWCRQITTSLYVRYDDEVASARTLITEMSNQGFQNLLFDEDEQSSMFGFITPFFDKVLNDPTVAEWHIDSTFKTKRSGPELFGIVANCRGSGYGAAYVLMDNSRAIASGNYLRWHCSQSLRELTCHLYS
jgi:hypothetical protein